MAAQAQSQSPEGQLPPGAVFQPKGRPVFLYQRIALAAAPAPPGTPSPVVRSDPTLMVPPEAMRVDYIVMDSEVAGQSVGIRARPQMIEQEYWPKLPAEMNLFNNLQRPITGDDYGEYWLTEPFLMRRGSHMNIQIQNRMVGLEAEGIVLFDGYGIASSRPKQLVIRWDMAAGDDAGGVVTTFGGQQSAIISGREDVLITKVSWLRGLESEAWNPRRIHIDIMPSYGQKWISKGGTARGAGSLLLPLAMLSNVRGPAIACFYQPDIDIIMDQGDEISFEFQNMIQGAAAEAILGVFGTTVAE